MAVELVVDLDLGLLFFSFFFFLNCRWWFCWSRFWFGVVLTVLYLIWICFLVWCCSWCTYYAWLWFAGGGFVGLICCWCAWGYVVVVVLRFFFFFGFIVVVLANSFYEGSVFLKFPWMRWWERVLRWEREKERKRTLKIQCCPEIQASFLS